MTKTKTYLDIVKKNVDSNILENLWNESISELTNNYLNEGYTLEELEPSVRKFSYTDVVRIAEDFIIHPYSKILAPVFLTYQLIVWIVITTIIILSLVIT
jgi:hypothetical protein